MFWIETLLQSLGLFNNSLSFRRRENLTLKVKERELKTE